VSTDPEPEIRRAGADDLERLAALHALCFEEAWDAASLARLLAMPGVYALVAESAAANGYPAISPLGLVLVRAGGGEAEILTIGVDPAARGRRIGRKLLDAAAAAAIAAGAAALFLEVAEDNGDALRLYERFGFYLVGMRPAYYTRGASRIAARTLKCDLPSLPGGHKSLID